MQPVGVTSPARGEAGLDARVGGEARQAVEEVADGAAGGDVGGESRVERAGVVVVPGIDDLVAVRRAGRPTRAEAKRDCQQKHDERSFVFH